MPLTRYQVRNEYSLADPELYRAADKDDPEALLEGVAMAGLIGVLRQLGDLAEFAAEIFHDLHEELMATAARGHGLMVRVQQIEAEFPSVEKEFLSQTSHSSFFYNTGVDWHPNLRMDHNLITQGDLPRFVMDSYEECRGPPRLFLLDKFDVAGAGACLKRYTDPSFFKVESSISGMSNGEYQREKRSRKTKKKGSRWKNGATPEVMATPHAKLHQLFLEERVENHSNDPARRVKLKKRLNGFPFHSRTGKSYMEKFLKTPIPDHDDVREISVSLSPVKLPANITGESGTEVIDISAMSPDKDVPQKTRSPWSSPDSETGHIPSINEIAEDDNYGISKALKFSSIAQIDDVLSTLHEEVDKKEISVEGERKVKGSVDGYQSDDVASEVDNYVDALATMDSEMETDSEYRANSDRHFLNIVDQGMSSDVNEELHDLQTHSSDSHSIANSTAMDDGNSSSRKGKSSLSYSDSFNLAENAQSDGETSVKTSPSAELSKPDFVNLSYDHVNGDAPLNQAPRHSDHDDVCDENADTSSYKSEFGEPSSSSCLTNLTPIFLPVDSGNHFMEVSSPPDLDVLSSNFSKHNAGYTSAEENMIHVVENLPCTSNLSDRPFQSRDDGHSELPLRTGSVDEVDDADSNISHASLHLPNILKLGPVEESNDMMQREHEEKESPRNLVDNLIQSLSSLPSHTEEHHLVRAKPEQESSGPHINPEGIVSEINDAPEEIARSSAPILDSSQTSNFVGLQLGTSENDHSHENGSEEVCFSYLREEKLDGASSTADVEELGGFSSGVDLAGKDDIDLKVTAEFQNSPDPPPVHDVSLSDVMNETVQFKAMFMPTAVAGSDLDGNGNDASSIYLVPTHLQGESSFFLQDSNQDSTEINETSPEHLQESAMEKVVGQQAVASSDLETMSCNTVHCDDSKSEVYHSISDITPETISGYSLHIAQPTAVPFSSYQCQQDAELKPLQQINVIEKDEDAPLDQKVEPQDDYLNVKSWHGEFSESMSSQQTDVIQDAEDTLSSSTRHLAEIGTLLDQKFESENDRCVISCHDQVVESKSSQQIDFVDKEDDVSSHSHHVVKLRIPPEHEQVPDSKLSQQINLMDKEQDAISSPTLRVAKHRIPSEENIELQNHQSDAESRHEQVLQSKSALQIDVIENAEDFIAELKTPLEQNGHVDVESWHNQDSESKSSQQFNAFENAEDGVSSPTHPIAELNSHLEQQVEFESDQSDLQSRHDLNSELKNSQQVKVTECSEITLSSVSHPIAELNTPIEQTVGLQDHFDEKFRHANEATTAPLSLVEREQSSSHVDQDRQIVPSSEAYALHLPSQPSVLSFLPQLSVSKQANDPLRSNLPSVGLLSEVSQINLDEMPPLPPLPPMQWRLGKAQHAFSAPERNSFGQFLDSNPPMFSSTTVEKSQSGQLAIEQGISYPLTPSFPHSVTEDDNSQHVFKSLAEYVVHPDLFSPQVPGLVKNRISEDDVTISSSLQSMTQVSVLPIEHSGKSESVLLASEGGKTQPSANPFPPVTNLEGTSSTFPSCSLPETPVEPLDESAPERILEDDKLQGISIVSGEQTVTFSSTNMSPPVLQDKQQQPVFSSSEGQSTWPSSSSLPLLPSEEGKTNGNRHMKLPRPRNPLIDAVVAHDKSKLRKVTQRDRPPIGEKVDERDSLLEQIRTKSFNLKPAVVMRPSIQGPKTNLKVSAILEKANAIRQALAGSDEDDDEDNWSDS